MCACLRVWTALGLLCLFPGATMAQTGAQVGAQTASPQTPVAAAPQDASAPAQAQNRARTTSGERRKAAKLYL
ncbi:MAG TPA: hypothetical protein VMD55_01330, partial [Terracidiphilus sp.]|nr:hypothetical protein [Terracidiphilus sp.]